MDLKDVLTKIHGGGAIDRKRKLLENKKGKARSKQFEKQKFKSIYWSFKNK